MTSESESVGATENSIEIDAAPARVWEIVSEIRNAPQWSSQAFKVLASGGRTTIGTRALNINKQGPVYWPTSSQVVEFEPERKIANRIGGHGTVWMFELEPTATGGTRLSERNEMPAVMTSLIELLGNKFTGSKTDEAGSRDTAPSSNRGPSTSLRRIKALAEQH